MMRRLIPYLLTGAISSCITAIVIIYHGAPALTDRTTPTSATASAALDTDQPTPPPGGQLPNSERATLIDQQQQTIAMLEQEVEWLQSVIEAIEQKPPKPTAHNPQAREVWFDEGALDELDLPDTTIRNLKEMVEDIALKKLNLRHKANREGWGRSRQLREQLQSLDQQLRNQLTNDEYDLMLYATGKNNRVEVTDTLQDSAAGYAGIHSGDVILSYGGDRIFEPATLFEATSQGNLGEITEVTVQRGGETLTLYVPRGSLGVRFKPVKRPPAP